MARFALLLLVLAPCLISAAQVTPLTKVLSMLKEMQAKGETAGKDERTMFAEYERWVEDERIKKDQEIKTGTRKAEKLAAVAEKTDSDVQAHKSAIATLDEEISSMETEKKSATELRSGENAEYRKLRDDYAESFDATNMAIQNWRARKRIRLRRCCRCKTWPAATTVCVTSWAHSCKWM